MRYFVNKSFLLIFLLFISCSQTTQDKKEVSHIEKKKVKAYVITGHVDHIPASKIYLNTMKLDSNDRPYWPIIDSADYVGGKFVLNRDTILLEPAWASNLFYKDSVTGRNANLAFDNKYFSTKDKPSLYTSFILENTVIKIEGDINDKNGLGLEGSKETDFDYRYGLMRPPYILLDATDHKIDSVKRAPDTSTVASFRMEKEELKRKYKENFKKILEQNPSTFQALSNLYQNADYFSLEELKGLKVILTKELLRLPTGKKLLSFIENRERLLPGKEFPDFVYLDSAGKKVTLHNVRGSNATLVVFWASWCVPCREEIPELKEFYQEYISKGISIVSISVDNEVKSWRNAVKKEQMPWINISNLPGDYNEINLKYNIKAIPSMYLLDNRNRILLANPYPQSIEKVKEELARKKI